MLWRPGDKVDGLCLIQPDFAPAPPPGFMAIAPYYARLADLLSWSEMCSVYGTKAYPIFSIDDGRFLQLLTGLFHGYDGIKYFSSDDKSGAELFEEIDGWGHFCCAKIYIYFDKTDQAILSDRFTSDFKSFVSYIYGDWHYSHASSSGDLLFFTRPNDRGGSILPLLQLLITKCCLSNVMIISTITNDKGEQSLCLVVKKRCR